MIQWAINYKIIDCEAINYEAINYEVINCEAINCEVINYDVINCEVINYEVPYVMCKMLCFPKDVTMIICQFVVLLSETNPY